MRIRVPAAPPAPPAQPAQPAPAELDQLRARVDAGGSEQSLVAGGELRYVTRNCTSVPTVSGLYDCAAG